MHSSRTSSGQFDLVDLIYSQGIPTDPAEGKKSEVGLGAGEAPYGAGEKYVFG